MMSAVGMSLAHASDDSPAWTSPGVTAIKRVSDLPATPDQPNYLSNLDCTSLSYRMVGQNNVQSGCFTPTAFGLFDSDDRVVIFNGTDEGLPLYSYISSEVLEPWPQALGLLTLDASNYGGAYLGMYKNPVLAMTNQRDNSGRLTAKTMGAPHDFSFKDPSGQLLRVNPQTISFSDNGSWMVAETLEGSFVRINLATLAMTAFAQSFGSPGSPALLKSQVTISDDGRFVAIGNNTDTSLNVYDLSTCDGVINGLTAQNCRSHNYWSFVGQHIPGLQSLRHIKFVSEGLVSFEAVASGTSASGVYELAPDGDIASLTEYMGLGDSYTSGEGAFDYSPGTDTDDDKCHLSVNSYPLLLARDLFGTGSGHSVACSGAIINDIVDSADDYRGQVKGGASFAELSGMPATLGAIQSDFSPGYLAQYRFVQQYQPAVVTVSIGGNDIGFGDILQNCVEPHVSLNSSGQTCYGTYESREEIMRLVDRTVPRWIALYRQLQSVDPGVRLYAIGYPSIASDSGSCGVNVRLSKDELTFSNELIDYLDDDIAQAAAAAGVPYVDISQALVGHRLCEASGGDIAMNGLTAGNDSGAFGIDVLGRESYHPNALGQELIEQAILRQTANLSSGTAAKSDPPDPNSLLDMPKSGASLYNLVPDDTVIDPLLRPGDSYSVRINGARDGLEPNSSYSVRLDGATGPSRAAVTSDVTGDIATSFTLTAGTTPGGHTIDITGTDQAGEPVDITQPVYIGKFGDADGDGVPDGSDSCPYVINSGQDTDHDGIDDACDPVIEDSASTSSGQGDTISIDQVSSSASLFDKIANDVARRIISEAVGGSLIIVLWLLVASRQPK
jgi:lysophospholipase L1-like esterase